MLWVSAGVELQPTILLFNIRKSKLECPSMVIYFIPPLESNKGKMSVLQT